MGNVEQNTNNTSTSKPVRINYQIMTEKRRDRDTEMYLPDWDAFLAGATCEEEKEYISNAIEQKRSMLKDRFTDAEGFAYNMIYITKQKCGHYEIFQTPCNVYHSLEENLRLAREHSLTSDCTKCVCGWDRR